MKNIKNKIAALVCGGALLCGTIAITNAANAKMECYAISITACGSHFETIACGNGMTLLDALGLAGEYAAIMCE